MKKKVLLIVLPIVLVIVAAVTIFLVFFLNKEDEEESVGSKWGDTYYAYLKEAINEKDLTEAEEKYGMMLDMKDAKLQFCEVDEGQDPTMIMTYKKNDSSYVNVYQITDKKKVTYIAYKQPTDVEYLYDIEKDEYSWYIHTNGTKSDSYSSLKNVANTLKGNSEKSENSENVNIAEFEADYTIDKEEAEITQETTDGQTLTMSKFDEIFVKPEIEQNIQIDFDVNIKEKDLKKGIETAVDDYKKDSKKITDEVKEDVAKKVEEIKTKKEELAKVKEETEKKKAEETKGLKVGNCTLKYGTYVYKNEYGENLEGTITLMPNGKFHIKSNFEGSSSPTEHTSIDCDGTYKIELHQETYPDTYEDFIVFTTETGKDIYFMVHQNDAFSDQWHGYSYVSDSTAQSTNNSSKSTNSNNNSTSASSNNRSSTSSSGSSSDTPTMSNAISQERAMEIAQNRWGTKSDETGYEIGYQYMGWIQDGEGMQYYVFAIKWLVENSHWSFLSTVCVSVDGKTYKEIGRPTSYTNGETVTQFDGEGKF